MSQQVSLKQRAKHDPVGLYTHSTGSLLLDSGPTTENRSGSREDKGGMGRYDKHTYPAEICQAEEGCCVDFMFHGLILINFWIRCW